MKNQLSTLLTTFIVIALIGMFAATDTNAQPCATDVAWSAPSSNAVVTQNSTTITKSNLGNGWNQGAYSLQPITAGGFVQFQAGQNNTYKMIGLNKDYATDHSYCSIDYAWYPHLSNATNIYESCASRGQFGGAYSTSDVFRVYWNPSNNRIQYLRNGVVQYTSSVVPSGTYYADISLYTNGASFFNVIVQGSTCGSPYGATVSWAGLGTNVTKTGTNIKKTSGDGGWNGGSYSLQPVNSGGWVEFQCGETNTWKMLGLNSDPATDHSYCSIDYAWYPHGSGPAVQIYENCGHKYSGPAYTTSDVFRIYWNPTNNKIEYYKNNVLQYTSTTTPSGTYYPDWSGATVGSSFTNVIVAQSVHY